MAGNIEKTSYDILEWFPILVCQEVFKNLDGKDVIQASAVNKQWYKFTAESQQIKKVKLVFHEEERQLTNEAMNILKASKRKYQNIEFGQMSFQESGNFISLLTDRASSWKSVVSKNCRLPGGDMWPQIFRIIEPSVEEFSLTQINSLRDSHTWTQVDSHFTFPRLKFLECVNLGCNYFQHFIGCTTLEKFYFPSLDPENKQDILKILCNNRNLKEILTKSNTLFDHSFEFKLKKLCVNSEYGNALRYDFFKFFQTQAQTLESLEIYLKLDEARLGLILSNMPKLSSFTTSFTVIRDAMRTKWIQPFPLNSSITTLELRQEIPDREQNLLEILIGALTNLKHFKCHVISDETFLTLVEHAPDLESMETHHFNVSRIPGRKIFLSLKTFKADAFNKNIQDRMGYGHFAMLVKAEMKKKTEKN